VREDVANNSAFPLFLKNQAIKNLRPSTPDRSESSCKKNAEGKVIILFKSLFKEKFFFEIFFLSVQQS
jgi:hypothetical protein